MVGLVIVPAAAQPREDQCEYRGTHVIESVSPPRQPLGGVKTGAAKAEPRGLRPSHLSRQAAARFKEASN
jgi:hypothetical protein